MKDSTKIILLKILRVILVLAIIYLSVGFIAGIGFIVIEAQTHKMSNEIGNDFNPWIIYAGMIVYLFIIGGLLMGAGIGFYKIRQKIRKSVDC